MLKDEQKPNVVPCYKGNLTSLFFFNSSVIYNNWYTETDSHE